MGWGDRVRAAWRAWRNGRGADDPRLHDLLAAQARLIDAMESSGDAFSVFDADDRLVAFNSRYREIYPTIADTVRIGIPFVELLRVSAHAGQYAGIGPHNADEWVRDRLALHRLSTTPFEQLLSDGRWLEVHECPTGDGGRVAIRRDITQRKAAEAAMRAELAFEQTLMDALPFPMFYRSATGIYLGCNQAFANSVGMAPDQIVGAPVERIFPPDLARQFRRHDAEVMRDGTIGTLDLTHRWSDGIPRQTQVVKSPFNGPDGQVAGIIGTIIDITAQKRAEERMVRGARMATVGEIASEMAHEMNQPLSIIRMAAENCQEWLAGGTAEPERLVARLGMISAQVARMGDMVGHLRGFSQGEAADRRPIQPLEAVTQAIDQLDAQLQLDDIALEVSLPASCPEVTGQAGQLEQVVQTLLANARDAILGTRQPGQGRIKVTLTLAGADTVALTVQDNGGGVPKDLWPMIFSPFFTTKGDGAGTGLGLSTSANIVAAMGGRIQGRNDADGAVFEVHLPALHDHTGPAAAEPEPPPASEPTILVVDDEPLAVDCIGDFLRGRGWRVVAAFAPQDALDLAQSQKLALVLTDRRMPGMDGNTLVERLRHLQPALPAILMSGGAIPAPPPGAGPTVLMTKPLVLEDLARNIAALLAGEAGTSDAAAMIATPAPPDRPGSQPPPLLPAPAATPPATQATERLWLMGEVVATLAHDLGQPLNIIRLNSESLLEALNKGPLPDERLRRALELCVEQCRRIPHMTDRIVAATQRPRGPASRLSPVAAARDALSMVLDRIRRQDIALIWHPDLATPKVGGHHQRLTLALAHLLDNACEALASAAMDHLYQQPPWRPRLSVTCAPHGEAKVALTIADNGNGLPAETWDRARAGHASAGLGLPIAIGVVAEMGGVLDRVTGPFPGTCLRLLLPVAGRRVLARIQDLEIRRDLERAGWVLADEREHVDIALVPLRPQDQRSWTLLQTLHDSRPDLPIAVHADLTPEQARRAVGLGATLILPGSATSDEIIEGLDDCVPD